MSRVSECRRCSLREGCDAVVLGARRANHKCDIFVVAEHPDADDELMMSPFSGRSGDMLRKLLNQADIYPADIYQTLAVKCRPKASKDIKAIHIQTCGEWLLKEIALIKPKVILSLGGIPTRFLMGLPRTALLGPVVGHFHRVACTSAAVAPWYSPNHILQHGKAVHMESISFFRKVKECSVA